MALFTGMFVEVESDSVDICRLNKLLPSPLDPSVRKAKC